MKLQPRALPPAVAHRVLVSFQMRVLLISAFGSVLFFVPSCIPLPDGPGRRVTSLPTKAALSGLYVLMPESVTFLRTKGFNTALFAQEHTLRLDADGSCSFYGCDSYQTMLPAAERRLVRRKGTWDVRVEKGFITYIILALHLREVGGSADGRTYSMRLARLNDRNVLWDFASDPDEYRYYIFEKTES
jgi:hypothetical protein